MAKFKPTVAPAPVVEVAPTCNHDGTLYDRMRQEPGSKTMLLKQQCTKCGYESDWKTQHEVLLRPLPPQVSRF